MAVVWSRKCEGGQMCHPHLRILLSKVPNSIVFSSSSNLFPLREGGLISTPDLLRRITCDQEVVFPRGGGRDCAPGARHWRSVSVICLTPATARRHTPRQLAGKPTASTSGQSPRAGGGGRGHNLRGLEGVLTSGKRWRDHVKCSSRYVIYWTQLPHPYYRNLNYWGLYRHKRSAGYLPGCRWLISLLSILHARHGSDSSSLGYTAWECGIEEMWPWWQDNIIWSEWVLEVLRRVDS